MAESLAGLEDVVVATSTICFIDGDKGILRYRGYDVNELGQKSTYEEVGYLLLYGQLPAEASLKLFREDLRKNRAVPEGLVSLLKGIPPRTDPMAWLRTAVSALAAFDPESEDNSEPANLRKTIRLVAQVATLVAAIDRIRNNQPLIAPDPQLDHASNFLHMLTGKKPDDLSRRAMDLALILQADHELNASTFAGRVTVSTLSDLHSAVTSAVGTLKGPLHGGANQRVMEMLDKVGGVEKVEGFIKEQLAAKKKIMGFGHRVYTTIDPRAAILKQMSRDLSQKIGPSKWFDISEAMETIMLREKNINANLDFYSASVYRYLGIATDLFPSIFATSRIVGWCTHFIEQYKNNRLIRPLTHYAGPQGLQYVPLASRNTASPH
ncbi:MAG: citrate synthase [Elusimicrobia bacterium RIFCSPLOWO2_01_FULL_59_12]|nr:MAG: citrate synthase [Elusimicrobia bacterium RIFCSPLOWO2_01_FULL_59_12]